MLSGEVDLRMYDAHVACQRIVAGEGLFFDAQCASNFLLSHIMNRILVSGEIVRTGKYGVARLAGCWVDTLALVRPRLRVPL